MGLPEMTECRRSMAILMRSAALPWGRELTAWRSALAWSELLPLLIMSRYRRRPMSVQMYLQAP